MAPPSRRAPRVSSKVPSRRERVLPRAAWHHSCRRRIGVPQLSSISNVVDGLKKDWRAFRRATPGQRFQNRYRAHQKSRSASPLKRVLSLVLAPLSLAIGVVLMFIPGPAILFFFIGGTLLASHSRTAARALDWAEIKLRSWAERAKTWWNSQSLLSKIPLLLGALLVAVGGSLAAIALLASRH